MDLISRNCDDGSINLADSRVLASETFQKDNIHLVEAMKADYHEDFMTVMEKDIKELTTEDVWEIIPKLLLTTSSHMILLLCIFKRKRNPLVELIKHKDHVFLHGGMIDFHNTFVPVVNFSNGSLIIMMAEISGWE